MSMHVMSAAQKPHTSMGPSNGYEGSYVSIGADHPVDATSPQPFQLDAGEPQGISTVDHAPATAATPEFSSPPIALTDANRQGTTFSFSSGFAGPNRSGTQNTQDTQHTNASSEFDDSDPWTMKTVLTLDGGGVRGYSSLLILEALMEAIAKCEKESEPPALSSINPLQPLVQSPGPLSGDAFTTAGSSPLTGNAMNSGSEGYLPCHYFDYIAGTSTGGLIAIMLSRLRMTVADCMQQYETLGDRVFGRPRRFHIRRPPWIPKEKYNHKHLEEVMKDVVKSRDPSGTSQAKFTSNEDMCRTIVVAWQEFTVKGTRVPYLFRSYPHISRKEGDSLERNPNKVHDYPIWKVARATSAAPTYFKAVRFEADDDDSEYIDGGFGANNPSEEAYRAVQQMHSAKAVSVLVSVGTGKPESGGVRSGRFWAKYYAYFKLAAKLATESERTHERIQDMTKNSSTDYFRLNVEQGLGDMKLDTWEKSKKEGKKTLAQIRHVTKAYLASDAAKELLEKSAKMLVDKRRLRAQNDFLDRWERFVHGVKYYCEYKDCNLAKKIYHKRADLCRHLVDTHRLPSEHQDGRDNIEHWLNEGRRYPVRACS